jgi:hypothetical protein
MVSDDTLQRSSDATLDIESPAGESERRVTRVRKRRRRRWYQRIPRIPLPVTIGIVVVLAALLVFSVFRVWTAYAAYGNARDDARVLDAYAARSLSDLTTEDIQQIEYRFHAMRLEFETLDRATQVPLVGGVVQRLPLVGARYKAGREAIEVARLIAGAGERGADIGTSVMAAYESTGISSETPPSSPTWLDVVSANEQDILTITDNLNRAREIRSGIDDSRLPATAQVRLEQMDRMMAVFDTEILDEQTFAALTQALGSERPMRYLVLFPNPAEMRMAGGFPGEIALVEVERGQLKSYEFFNVAWLNIDYMAQRTEKVPLPWAYEQYFWQDGFLLQDTVWIADFAEMGAQLMEMYAQTDWPPIDGVVAAQATVPADLLRITGPVVVDVDGDTRVITSSNLYTEMERQRRLRLEGESAETHHKEVIATVGEEIIERLKDSARGQLAQAVKLMIAGADRRDIQAYVAHPEVQQWLDRYAWTGRLQPRTDTPTVAVVFGSLVAHKADLVMQPSMTAEIGPEANGMREVTLEIGLQHTGTNEDLPFYSGFHRWWIEVTLPDGAQLHDTSKSAQPDPNAPNGGAYLVELFPQQSDTLTLTFSIPADDELLIRRQPGVNPVELTATLAGCTEPAQLAMDSGDVVLHLDGSCAVVNGKAGQVE